MLHQSTREAESCRQFDHEALHLGSGDHRRASHQQTIAPLRQESPCRLPHLSTVPQSNRNHEINCRVLRSHTRTSEPLRGCRSAGSDSRPRWNQCGFRYSQHDPYACQQLSITPSGRPGSGPQLGFQFNRIDWAISGFPPCSTNRASISRMACRPARKISSARSSVIRPSSPGLSSPHASKLIASNLSAPTGAVIVSFRHYQRSSGQCHHS